jgi:hypothetical protein
VRQRVVMAVRKAQAGVLINRLHYALTGWDGAEGRRNAQEDLYESAQARGFADRVEFTHLDFDDAGRSPPRKDNCIIHIPSKPPERGRCVSAIHVPKVIPTGTCSLALRDRARIKKRANL